MTLSLSARRRISTAFALVLIAAVAAGLYVLLKSFWSAFNQLNPTVAAGILAAVTTILVSVLSVLTSKHLEQRNNVLKELRDKKAPVYEDLLAFIFRILNAQRLGLPSLTEKEVVTNFSSITQRLIIWGSDDVVQALYKFRISCTQASIDNRLPGLAILAVEELFFAIRKDLGHHNKGLTTGKILGTFINDLHNLFDSRAADAKVVK